MWEQQHDLGTQKIYSLCSELDILFFLKVGVLLLDSILHRYISAFYHPTNVGLCICFFFLHFNLTSHTCLGGITYQIHQ